MNRALIIFVLYLHMYSVLPQELPDLKNSDLFSCLECLCHAVSGCYRRQNCARYSISRNYWTTAGSPGGTYEQCLTDENCILNTIKGYTDTFDNNDCNCDGNYDCRDMLTLHLFGKCETTIPAHNLQRYNNCVARPFIDLPPFVNNKCNEPQAQ